MTEFGLYVLTKEYMEKHYIAKYPQDRETGARPFFFALKDQDSELFWFIPISSKIDKYQPIIQKYPNAGIVCELYGGKQSAILVQNIIPAKIEHIEREFTVNSIHYILKDTNKINTIKRKAKNVLAIIKHKDVKMFKEVKELYWKLLSK